MNHVSEDVLHADSIKTIKLVLHVCLNVDAEPYLKVKGSGTETRNKMSKQTPVIYVGNVHSALDCMIRLYGQLDFIYFKHENNK